ncbi:hypothetical protein LA303_04990 [Candidatus Sulfidibacterium hydrothermale]|uniref:hypothetical protein n=1 Tax=Candidatus Sulfidibacterium hydrothermale TaxID=2875962 RepID=UPI001F0AD498|nr:hypothetical protein [Candidatus Sulfidibacterium hydrothermale]UBM63331.1 hypothetical protein LA303_04990 [Candidatus Sulfidibacterium hydrothermale]
MEEYEIRDRTPTARDSSRNERASVSVNAGNFTAPSKSACVSVDKPVLLPVMLVSGRAGRSIRFGPPSLVPFLAEQERNKKTKTKWCISVNKEPENKFVG